MFQQFSHTVLTLTVETNTADNDSDRHLDDTDRTDADTEYIILLHTNTQTHTHIEQWEQFLILANVFISFLFFFALFNWCDVPTILFARQSTYGSLSQSTEHQNTHFRLLLSLQLQMWAHTNTQRAHNIV